MRRHREEVTALSKLINILFRKRKRAVKERALNFNYELLDQNRDAVLMALYLGNMNR
jgi:flagellar motor component MotA